MADSWFITPKTQREFYCAARPGYYPALSGHYRPLNADAAIEWTERRNRVHQDQLNDWDLTFLADKIVDWNANAPLTLAVMQTLDSELYFKLRDQILMNVAPDPQPKDTAPPITASQHAQEKKDD